MMHALFLSKQVFLLANHKKVVIVTGAARGIGLATSKLFLKNNFKVAMVDRDFKELKKIKIDGSNHKIFNFDISDVKTNNIMVKKICKHTGDPNYYFKDL